MMAYDLKSIPLYTNSSEQSYGWFIIYNNHSIVYEHTSYAHIQYSTISKSDINLFGLYGNGFKLVSNFSDGTMYIYWKDNQIAKFNFLLSNKAIETNLNSHVYHCRPFHLKSFIYDFNMFNTINSNGYMTNKYYSGYNGLILANNYPLKVKQYFSIDLMDHPKELAIITKLEKIKDIEYPKDNFIFSVIKNDKISKDNVQLNLLNDNVFKHKTIFKL